MTPESALPSLAPTLVFTNAAATKVGELIREEANPNLKLRVFVQGGGCSGFQYGFTFDENTEEGDTRVENGGVTLLIDPMSIQYLAGDRKSTRLNSSHGYISYAVFCLKKK